MIEVRYIGLKDIERIRDFYKRRNKIVMINLFNFGINVGFHISDIFVLKFEDILKNNIITIREKKTGKRKSFPLNSVCLKAINDLKKYYKSLGYNIKTVIFSKALTKNTLKI